MNIGNMVSGKARQRKVNLVSNYIVQKPTEVNPVEPPLMQPYYKKNIEDYVARSNWMDKIGLQLADEEIVKESEENAVKVEIRRTL